MSKDSSAILTSMKKGRDYARLRSGGLPIPDHGVFDDRCLCDAGEFQRLSALVGRILAQGSGQIGVRTEPKEGASPLGNYPHIMPLRHEHEVRSAIESVIRGHPEHTWWFLVNEAFTEYEWNAVVMATERQLLPGGARLVGDVNDRDNLPLREAMANSTNCTSMQNWQHPHKQWLRSVILGAGLLEEWLEVSSVYARGQRRRVFWGMR